MPGPRLRSHAIAGIACLAMSVAAQAQPRQLRAIAAPGHDPLFIDSATLKRSGSERYFRYVLDVPVALEAPAEKRRWRSNEMEALIDCAKNTYSVLSVVAHSGPGATGSVVWRRSGTEADRKPAGIVRGSTFDFLAQHVCRR
jgi:hypothetical protein